jgi:hypothetical protein
MRTAPVGSLETLLETLDHRRPAIAAHSRRVAVFARQLGIVVGLPAEELATLVQAALVHDAGALIGRECEASSDLSGLHTWCGLLDEVEDVLWYSTRRFDHHRHAPLGARLLAVAHAFDELTATREYRVPLSAESAMMAIAREAGRRYCPVAVNALIAARFERIQPGLVVEDLGARPETPARVDGGRLGAGTLLRVDYRLVTTS